MSAISNYLLDRLTKHQQFYYNQGLTDDDCILNDRMDNIFNYLYMVLDKLLQNGNTLLSLYPNTWVDDLLSPMIAAVCDELSELNFDILFSDIAIYSNDYNEFTRYVKNIDSKIRPIFDNDPIFNRKNSHIAHHAYHQILDKIKLILQMYYVCYYQLDYAGFITFIRSHPLVTTQADNGAPIVLIERGGCHLWLYRSYLAEHTLLTRIKVLSQTNVQPLPIITTATELNSEQKQAVAQAMTSSFSIITGGPGTGKTFTVAQIVLALYATSSGTPPRLALVAPTGKAAQRMSESLQKAIQDRSIALPEPMTVHRLLGIGSAGLPRYNGTYSLPYDMIIVDEASMLGVELASMLLSAVAVDTRLILLGDAHQLAAVEAGAVLADLCHLDILHDERTQLIQSKRFGSGSAVGALAQFINADKNKTIVELQHIIHAYEALRFYDIDQYHDDEVLYKNLIYPFINNDGYINKAYSYKDSFYQMDDADKLVAVRELMAALNRYRILTASHIGICGDTAINSYIQDQHINTHHLKYISYQNKSQIWYHGRPIMILKNRYDLGLFNGDIGICLQSDKHPYKFSVYFDNNGLLMYDVNLLDGDMVASAYAMTVHKSQGSEFDDIAVVFDERAMRLLTKELIYTAITRAKLGVSIYSNSLALLTAINTPTVRNTGLSLLAE